MSLPYTAEGKRRIRALASNKKTYSSQSSRQSNASAIEKARRFMRRILLYHMYAWEKRHYWKTIR
jgi:hypothetical protein